MLAAHWFEGINRRIRKFLGFSRQVIVCVIDTFLLVLIKPPKRTRAKAHLLLVRVDAIGDFILWLDAAKGIRELYPQESYQITLLANHAWATLAESSTYFDSVWSIDRQKFYKNVLYRLKKLVMIRRADFDVVIQPTCSREFCYGDSIVRLSGARERVGAGGDFVNIRPWQKRISDGWYTRLIATRDESSMELERNADFVRGLGLENFRAGLPRLPFFDSDPICEDKYFVIFPGASVAYRKWDILNFRELASRLYQEKKWHAVICGGPGEEPLGLEFTRDSEFPVTDVIGLTTLPELADIIRKSQVLITNETSALHVAAAVSTPALCIMGGGHFGRFSPYKIETDPTGPLPASVIFKMPCFGCNWTCIHPVVPGSPVPCIAEVGVEEAWKVLLNLI